MDELLKNELQLAREHYQRSEHEQAEPLLRKVIEQAQGYADVYNMLGVIVHARGELDEARTLLERAVEINPNYTEASLNLAVTYNDLGLYDQARTTYAAMRSVVDAEPRQIDPFVRGKLANMHADTAAVYAELGMCHEAAGEYRKALWLSPTYADLRARLATVLRDMGDLDGAVLEYREALRTNPKFVAAHVLLGVAYLKQGRRELAGTQWEQALEIEPEHKSAQMYLRMLKTGTLPSTPPPGASPTPTE